MERLDHFLEFRDLRAVMARGRIAALGRIESHRAVAPVIAKLFAGLGIDPFVFVFVELENRHQLDAIHPDRLEVGDLLDDSLVGAGVPHSG